LQIVTTAMAETSRAAVEDYYDKRVEEKLRDFTHFNPRIEAAIETLAGWAPVKPRRVLEIGCGIGAASWRMARAWPQAEVIGADISPVSIDVARACFRLPNLSYHAGLIEEGALKGKFDLIVMMDVYEHIAPAARSGLHAAIRNLLADDARFVLAFPTPTLQNYAATNSPQDLQPIDECIGYDEIAVLARETATEIVYYRTTGVWHYGDYAHLVLARYRAMTEVKLREYVHPSRLVRLKQMVKRLIGREAPSRGVRDYLGPDLMRPRPFDGISRFDISARVRRAVAARWLSCGGPRG
jgi:SAM-dependent methyltransferase